MSENKFEQWAILEIMGHQRYAGLVSEQSVGGSNFVRLDVPQSGDRQPFTKLFGSSAIYAITIVDEETARGMCNQFCQEPMSEFSAREMLGLTHQSGELFDSRDAEDDLPI
jgi:hypothetical protein